MLNEKTFPESCYFIGIGGVSMSALAMLLSDNGVSVRGSDACESEYTKRLVAHNIPVHIGTTQKIYEQAVVYTSAVEESNPQLIEARKTGKPTLPRSELLGRVASQFPHVLSVAGCHGKTSTTAMLAHIFDRAKRRYTCHIGGDDLSFHNYRAKGGDYFITEACEFRRSFLSIQSEIAVILNTDRDHTDCYHSEEELIEAYALFAKRAQRAIVCADDKNARNIPHALTFGRWNGDIRAVKVSSDRERYRFTVVEGGIPMTEICLSVCGEVHVLNALAAYAAARLCGLSANEIKAGIERFRGVKRRFERIGRLNGAPVVCDYAHHPRELAAAIATAERMTRGTVRVVFQPHTYTRTRDLLDDFVAVLKRAENPIIYKTYAAREAFDGAGSAYFLTSKIPEASYCQTPEQLKIRLLGETKKKDVVLILGAGDIYDVAKQIIID